MIRYILLVILTAGLSAETIFAQGTEADSFLDQSLSVPVSSARNTVNIEQVGTFNTATVTSSGNGSLLALSQRGDDQKAEVAFEGSDNLGELLQQGQGNQAAISISGGTNVFSIEQTTTDLAGLRGNSISLSQLGLGNLARQTQRGNENEMTLFQSGDANSALMQQNGTSNVMQLEQLGNGNFADLSQTGVAAPLINVLQIGGMSVSISQTGN